MVVGCGLSGGWVVAGGGSRVVVCGNRGAWWRMVLRGGWRVVLCGGGCLGGVWVAFGGGWFVGGAWWCVAVGRGWW